MSQLKHHEWVAIWNHDTQQVVLGHIVFKLMCKDSIIVEHWFTSRSSLLVTSDSNPPMLNQCFGCLLNQEKQCYTLFKKETSLVSLYMKIQ